MQNTDDIEVADVPDQFDVKFLSSNGLECAFDIQPMITASSDTTSQISTSTKILATNHTKSHNYNVQQRIGYKFPSTDIRIKSDSKNSRTKIDQVSVHVTHIVSPHRFYVHHKQFSEMKDSIQGLCAKESLHASKLESISLNTTYLIHVPQENGWYRGMVRKDLGNDLFEVFYVDYGNQEDVKKHR